MFNRRPSTTGSDRQPSRFSRNRSLAAVAALAVLIGAAAVIGGASRDDGSDRAVKTSSSGDSAGATASKSASPATTIAPRGSSVAENAGADQGGAGASSASGAGGSSPTAQVDQDSSARNAVGAPVQPKVIRTGSIKVEVNKGDFQPAVSRLTDLAAGVGGFVSASETSQLGDNPRGSVTLRVPAKDFDRVLSRIGDLGKVQSVTTGSQDVTGEYTDVASRIKALQAEREQINLVLGRAESIPDILSVRDRLSVVQGELEQLQGRQQVLDDQTTLSTITVSLSEKGAKAKALIPPDQDRRGLAKVWHDSAQRFGDGASNIAVGFAAMAPWLLLIAILWLPARWLWRRNQEQAAPRPTPTATTSAD